MSGARSCELLDQINAVRAPPTTGLASSDAPWPPSTRARQIDGAPRARPIRARNVGGALSRKVVSNAALGEPGLSIEAGQLRDLVLEGFSIAITATLEVRLTNIRIESRDVAVRVEPSAILVAGDLAITGPAGACAPGIQLGAGSRFEARGLVTRMLGAHLDAGEQSQVGLASSQLSGDPACPQAVLGVAGALLSIESTTIEGGRTAILFAAAPGAPTRATLTDTTLRNALAAGLAGSGVMLAMEGGALSGNGAGDHLAGAAEPPGRRA